MGKPHCEESCRPCQESYIFSQGNWELVMNFEQKSNCDDMWQVRQITPESAEVDLDLRIWGKELRESTIEVIVVVYVTDNLCPG